MKNLLTACVIVLGVVFVYGFIRGERADRLRLSKIDEKRGLTLVVSMPDQDERYIYLHVYACAAVVMEQGTYCADDGWESRTDRLIKRSIESIPFPDAPKTTLRFHAYALDIDERVIASNTLTMFRGW